MIETHITRVQCEQAVEAGKIPFGWIRPQSPPRPGLWYLPAGPVILDGQTSIAWQTGKTDADVQVPLYPYLTMDEELSTLLGSGLLIGMIADHYLPPAVRLEGLHMFLGGVWTDQKHPGGHQYWLGFACRCVGPNQT